MQNRTIFILIVSSLILFACDNWTEKKNYYENETVSSILEYKNDKLDGESRYYYENGSLQSIYNYKEGILNGRSATWYLNENLESEAFYSNGLLEGSKKYFSENNIPTSVEHYHNDSLDGEYLSYHPNGKVKIRGYYTMGLYDSTWVYLDRFGVMVGKAEFIKGCGNQIAYYPNGNRKQLVPYVNNEIDGLKEFYNTDGKLIKVHMYENGIFIRESLK